MIDEFEFYAFKHCVIGIDKMPDDTTLNNMKKIDLIKFLHTAQHNYESLIQFHNNAIIKRLSNEQYNKAIDDFVKLVRKHDWNIRNINENSFIYGAIDTLAEQLKAGGENDNLRK